MCVVEISCRHGPPRRQSTVPILWDHLNEVESVRTLKLLNCNLPKIESTHHQCTPMRFPLHIICRMGHPRSLYVGGVKRVDSESDGGTLPCHCYYYPLALRSDPSRVCGGGAKNAKIVPKWVCNSMENQCFGRVKKGLD